jgi:hypothetical protein
VIDQLVPYIPLETNMTAMMRGFAALVLATGVLLLVGCADTGQPQQSAVSNRIPAANFAPADLGGFVSQSIPGIQSRDGFNYGRGLGGLL